jgi:acyl carrier protein
MEINEILNYLKDEIAAVINQGSETIDADTNFLKLGISSIDTLKLISKIQKNLEIEINPIAMFEYKTIAEFATYLNECMLEVEEV